jgi:hypothetical protein
VTGGEEGIAVIYFAPVVNAWEEQHVLKCSLSTSELAKCIFKFNLYNSVFKF